MCDTCGCEEKIKEHRHIEIKHNVLMKNDELAAHNRGYFKEHNIAAINLMSSPGSGKTSLLEKTLSTIRSTKTCAVIEGDQQTDRDAVRIAATEVPVYQVNTGKGCHLDAGQVAHACQHLSLKDDSLLFIENVGNLVCPASFDLGEAHKVVILSVTEGEDKPIKYPHMFHAADAMVINKIDLLPYVDFDVDQCIQYAHQVNPSLNVFQLSVKSGLGFDSWFAWLESV